MKILLIEDLKYCTLMVEKFLASSGNEVISAQDGNTALEILDSEESIDCVISDLFLPDMNGFQIYLQCQKLKKYNKYNIVSPPPFVLLTSSTNAADYQKAQSMGFAAALSKPFNPTELQQVLLKVQPDTEASIVNISKPTILIVDSKGDNYSLIKELYPGEYNFICVTAGFRCLEFLEYNHSIEAIICDERLPDMTLDELFRDLPLVTSFQSKKILPPILLLTQDEKREVTEKSYAKLSVSHLSRSMNPCILRSKISKVLGRPDYEQGQEKNILIVDDLAFNLALVKNILRKSQELSKQKYGILTASTGQQALSLLQVHNTIPLVVCDLMLPDIDGITLFKEYKQFVSEHPELYRPNDISNLEADFILLTASGQTSQLKMAKKLGFVETLNKPANETVLLDKVHSLLVKCS